MKRLLIIPLLFLLTQSIAQNSDFSKSVFVDTAFINWFIETECKDFKLKYIQEQARQLMIPPDSSIYDYVELPLADSQVVQKYDDAYGNFKFSNKLVKGLQVLSIDSLRQIEKNIRKTDPEYDIRFLALSIPYTLSNGLIWLLVDFNLGAEQGAGLIYLYAKNQGSYKLIKKKITWIN